MKVKTLEQVEIMKDKAERFVRDVLEDDERAGETEDESPEDYAGRKRIRILPNPYRRVKNMASIKADLEARIEELEAENEALRDKLDAIGEVLSDEVDEAEDDEADEQ
jgi:uncharacterized protein YceH (UPF0502 family)